MSFVSKEVSLVKLQGTSKVVDGCMFLAPKQGELGNSVVCTSLLGPVRFYQVYTLLAPEQGLAIPLHLPAHWDQ